VYNSDMDASANINADDRMGMTEEQWAIFQRLTSGYGDQDENGIDLSLLRQNLMLTPDQRLRKLEGYANELLSWERQKR